MKKAIILFALSAALMASECYAHDTWFEVVWVWDLPWQWVPVRLACMATWFAGCIAYITR